MADTSNSVTLADISAKLEQLDLKVDHIQEKQDKIDHDLCESGGLHEKLSNLDSDTGENTAMFKIQNKQFLELKREVVQLKALVSKQNQQISSLQRDNDELKNRNMRNNILIHKIPESKSETENCESTAVDFLKSTGMANTGKLVFERVHRIGPYSAHSKNPRPIVAKLLSSKDTNLILQHSRSLPKDETKPYITPQFTPQLREKRKILGALASDIRKRDEKVKTKVVYDKLYINGELHKEPFMPPTATEMLNITPDDQKELDEGPTLTHGDPITISGHTFTATAASVQTINQARVAYRKLLQNPACLGAAHNIAAYHLYNTLTTKSTTGYQDDGEHGAGRYISELLHHNNAKNVVVFVTRQFMTSSHLGAARFDAIEKAVESCLKKL